MSEHPETPPPDWNLGEWEKALTIKVGTAYACRRCENLVMVTRGGVGTLDLVCCDRPMERMELRPDGRGERGR